MSYEELEGNPELKEIEKELQNLAKEYTGALLAVSEGNLSPREAEESASRD